MKQAEESSIVRKKESAANRHLDWWLALVAMVVAALLVLTILTARSVASAPAARTSSIAAQSSR
jgi:lipopolysaccharide/colanic/teichoic acid biosynthesis glycosyltransferase